MSYLHLIDEHDRSRHEFEAALHGAKLTGGGSVRDRSPLRALHDRIARRMKGGR